MNRPIRAIRHLRAPGKRALLVMCAVVLALLGYTSFRDEGILGTWRVGRTQANLEAGNRGLKEENAAQRREVDDLRHNRKRVEVEARRLGLMYPDEVVVIDNGAGRRPGNRHR